MHTQTSLLSRLSCNAQSTMQSSNLQPLVSVCVVFLLFGMFVGNFAVSVADIEKALGFSHAAFGLMFAASLLVGAGSSALISVRAHKRGAGKTMRETLLALVGVLLIGTVVPESWVLALMFVVVMGTTGAVDVVMNTMATSVVKGRPAGLLRIHAVYCAGAAVGAIATGLFVANDASFRALWPIIAAIATASYFLNWHRFDEYQALPEEHVPFHAAMSSLVRNRLLIVTAAFILGAIIEGGIDAWGPLYLRTELNAGAIGGAAATAVGYTIGFASRMSMSVVSAVIGAKRCALFGAFVAATGLTLLVSSHSLTVASIGLALAVGGITANWPLLISYATENNPNAGLVTGGISTAGYVGLVIGPTVLGSVATAFSLRSSLMILAGGAVVTFLLLAPLPRHRSVPAEIKG